MSARVQALEAALKQFDAWAYRLALSRFDWQFQFSDDHWYVRDCVHQLELLRKLRERLDPVGAIWNSYAPSGYVSGVAA